MKEKTRKQVEGAFARMDTSLRDAGTHAARFLETFAACDDALLVRAMREVAGLQTALGEMATEVENLRHLLADPDAGSEAGG